MSKETFFVKNPCAKCPYRVDVKPYLTPERGEELAICATNPYNSFACHLTTVSDGDGERYCTENTKQCAGFITLQINEGMTPPEGFKPSNLVYESWGDMAEAYSEQ